MLFRQIEYFQAIIETGNFYQAAEKCNVSQSAISQQIKKLEQELGVKLLDRHNRTFSLTPAGEHFYRKSLILISDVEQIKRETKRIAAGDHAILRIGYYKGYHSNELSEAVAEFSSKYPTVEVSIIVGSHEELYISNWHNIFEYIPAPHNLLVLHQKSPLLQTTYRPRYAQQVIILSFNLRRLHIVRGADADPGLARV